MSTYVNGITYTGSGTVVVGKTETVGGNGVVAKSGSVKNHGTVAVTTGGGSPTGGLPGIYAGQSAANYGSATGGSVGGGGGAGGAGIQLRFFHGQVSNTGTITGGLGDKDGGAGVLLMSDGYVNNGAAGTIAGGVSIFSGGAGVKSVALGAEATVSNSGLIEGGVGYGGFVGGAGVYLYSGGTVDNNGSVLGGSAFGTKDSLPGGGYSEGVLMTGAGTVTNSGTIAGGGKVGYGVDLGAGGEVVNGSPTDTTALIKGRVGVQIGGGVPHRTITGVGTVTNYGVIDGGVVLAAAADRLVVEPGSSITGAVVGGAGVLELAGGAGVLTNLGGAGTLTGATSATFSGFGAYAVDAGASWSLAGAATLAAGQTLDVDGTVKLDAAASFANAGVVKTETGAVVILKGAVVNSGVLKAKGGDLTIKGTLSGSGSAAINGGVLTIDPAFGETIAFNGPSGELVLAQSQAFSGQISGFSTTGGTSLDLEDIAFVDAGQASFLGATTSGVLTVSDGTHTAHVTLVGDYTNSVFIAASDGHGGTVIVDPSASAEVKRFAAASAGLGTHMAAAAQTPVKVNWIDPPMMAAGLPRAP